VTGDARRALVRVDFRSDGRGAVPCLDDEDRPDPLCRLGKRAVGDTLPSLGRTVVDGRAGSREAWATRWALLRSASS